MKILQSSENCFNIIGYVNVDEKEPSVILLSTLKVLMKLSESML